MDDFCDLVVATALRSLVSQYLQLYDKTGNKLAGMTFDQAKLLYVFSIIYGVKLQEIHKLRDLLNIQDTRGFFHKDIETKLLNEIRIFKHTSDYELLYQQVAAFFRLSKF